MKRINHRWKCVQCGHTHNAPSKMNKMDPRRFCLECSKNSKRLIERVCPTIEKKRSAKKEQRKSAARKQKERKHLRREKSREQEQLEKEIRKDRPWAYHDDAIMKEYRRLCRVKSVLGDSILGGEKQFYPELKIRRSERSSHKQSGTCYNGGSIHCRIAITIGWKLGRADICMLLLHELIHARGVNNHSQQYRAAYGDAARDAYKINPKEFSHNEIYQVDLEIAHLLHLKFDK